MADYIANGQTLHGQSPRKTQVGTQIERKQTQYLRERLSNARKYKIIIGNINITINHYSCFIITYVHC